MWQYTLYKYSPNIYHVDIPKFWKSTSFWPLFFQKNQLVIPYSASLIQDNECTQLKSEDYGKTGVSKSYLVQHDSVHKYLRGRVEEEWVGIRALGREQMELLAAAGLLQDLGRVDDVVKVHLDEAVLARLAPRGPQAAEGHVGPIEAPLVLVLQDSNESILWYTKLL